MFWPPYDFTLLSYSVNPPVDTAGGPFTMELARQAAEERGELFFPSIWTRDMLLGWVAPYLAAAYVDWENMTCNFDSPDFIALLEGIREHPADFEDIPDGTEACSISE